MRENPIVPPTQTHRNQHLRKHHLIKRAPTTIAAYVEAAIVSFGLPAAPVTGNYRKHAAFFLPYLRPGMTLLDVGCGSGSITIDLAETVAPGQVVGIDVNEGEIERARANAKERGTENIRFEIGNVYAIPLPDNSCDAVFSHGLFQYLEDPTGALQEMHRVLKPGGVVGVRTVDYDGRLRAPSDPLWSQTIELIERLRRHNGGNPSIGKHLRALMGGVGFCQVVATASYSSYGTPESIRAFAETAAQTLEGSPGKQLVQLGWVDRETLASMRRSLRTWGENPGAFHATANCEAVGWKE